MHSEEDQNLIEEGVNEYLREAAVPQRPYGYSWHLRILSGRHLTDLWDVIGQQEQATGRAALRSADTAAAIEAAVGRFYRL